MIDRSHRQPNRPMTSPLKKTTLLVGWTCIVLGLSFSISATEARAQSGLRESLELLDRNKNGSIEPDEITPLARPYLERVAKARRMSLDRPNGVDKWQEAARVYYALQNGVRGERIRASGERSLKGFGPQDDDVVVPEFGLAEVKYRYQQRDLDEADDTLKRYDRNRDGYMSRYEASRARWTHRDPFAMDLDKDDQLSRLELAQRYARRRMLSNDSGELMRQAWRTGTGVRPSASTGSDDRRRKSEWWRSGGDRFWLTASILGRFDANHNGRLEREETVNLGIPTGAVDADQNGELSREELFAYLKDLQDQTGGQVDGLPGWFYELDANHDKQIDLTEFAIELTDARVAEFLSLDANQDGLLAANEVLTSKSMMGGTFENVEAEMLPPRKTIVSEIDVAENFVIADLNLRLTLTHTNVSSLDAYLTGPDGTRIELFTAVGGRDDHFEKTIFDDQSSTPIVKARPPFEGSFQPEGLTKRQPGLAAFNGQSIEGVWQLTIRCSRSDRFGMLHSWALLARPDEESLLSRPELAASMASTSANDDAASTPDESQPAAAISFGTSRAAVAPSPLLASPNAGFWTAERKAEYKQKLKKPSPADWEKMSDDEKRQKMAARSKAIEDYKRALDSKRSESGKIRGEGKKSKDKDRGDKTKRRDKIKI